MQDIFISIIVPVYNVERYLRACLDSIARLSSVCWEAILIDDGSTDASGGVCDEYAAREPRFRVIHQQNAGVSAARNAGLEAARGEWIWFVDSDDVVDVGCVPQMYQWLLQNPNVDYVMFDLQKFDDGERIHLNGTEGTMSNSKEKGLGSELKVIQENSKNDFLLKHVCSYHCTLWYKRKLIELHQNRFTLGIRNSEDGEFMAKYLMVMKHPVFVNTVVYYYRMREGSAMHLPHVLRNIVEDVPVVFFNLLKWMDMVGQGVEPWWNHWIMKMVQNLLVQAGRYQELDKRQFQKTIRKMLDACADKGFSFVHDKKMRLAYRSVTAYFWVNKLYLKLKSL